MASLAPSPIVHPAPAPQTPAAFSGQLSRRAALYDGFSSILQGGISAVALTLLSPFFALIAIFIKLSSPGPVFYRGERVGRDLRCFTIYKFRTMFLDTEAQIGRRLLTREEQYRYCTPIGRLLKRTKLDELPQLVNVLKGQMRLVGPRPVRPIFLKHLLAEIPDYARRFLVPPGITGIAQLRGGYYTSPRNKFRYDLVYINNRTVLLDLRLVVLTFIKIFNRWLSMGLVVLFLFLFASFVPAGLHPAIWVPGLGVNIGFLTVMLIALSAWVFVKVGPAQFSLYRSPINLPLLLFVSLSGISTALAADPSLALRGSVYYVATGFLTAFVIVNTLATTTFITWTVRVIALTSAVISLLGLFGMFAVNHALGSTMPDTPGGLKVSSVFGSPVALAVYLVLGMPLLLAEVTSARRLRHRDFWLVCATISFVGVFLTQTRVGLLALLVTGTLYLYRRRANVLAFVTIFLMVILLLVSLGPPRFSVSEALDAVRYRIETDSAVFERPLLHWLIGAGAATTAEVISDHHPRPSPVDLEPLVISNMHLTLITEHGILGWLLVMWIVVAAIAAIKQAHDRTKDKRIKTLAWAILSSLVGYLVSMASMNTFHHLPIQVFFWSLVGIGLALATRVQSRRRRNVIWRFGESGD